MSRPVVVAAFGIALAAVLVVGTIDTLIWLPQYLAPGIPLDRIHDALAASHDLPFVTAYAVVWLVFWSLLAAVYVGLLLPALRRLRSAVEVVRPVTAAALGALLLGGTGFLHWWSAFAMGMSVSDELPPYAGGTTPVGVVIVVGGMLSGAAGIVLGITALATRPNAAPATT